MFLKSCFARVHAVSVVERAESSRLKLKEVFGSEMFSRTILCALFPSLSLFPLRSHTETIDLMCGTFKFSYCPSKLIINFTNLTRLM